MKNAFVLWYLLIVGIWLMFSVLVAAASADLNQVDINSTWNASAFNASDNPTGINQGMSFVDSLASFHSSVFWIDVFLGFLGIYFVWVVASTFFGIGGGGG